MKSFIMTAAVLIGFLFMGCSPKAQTTDKTTTTTRKTVNANAVELLQPADFSKNITPGKVQLVDIRTPGEYNQGHMEGALNYDYYKPTFMQQMNTLDKTRPVYIYCRSGSRSGHASKKLKDAGFTKVYDLQGGINNWLRKGFKLIK